MAPMPLLHMSKVAVGCASLGTLQRRNDGRTSDGVAAITTRFCPKRADELVGGSVFWIIKHRITARQTILGFDVDAVARRTTIRLDARLVPVRAVPKRAHQGWRYLAEDDAPKDFDGDDDGLALLPPALLGKLVSLALL